MTQTLLVSASALQQANGGSREPLPKGNYTATVFEVKAETVKSGENAGKPRWNVTFKVQDGEHAGRLVWGYVALYPNNGLWKTLAFFSALGYEVAEGAFTIPEIADVQGKTIGIRVGLSEDQNGAPRNDVNGFDKPGAASAPKAEAPAATAKDPFAADTF